MSKSDVEKPAEGVPRSVSEIDWARWRAREPATLVVVVEGDRVLLIRKKRGFGAGKISAPGGRLDPGETPRQAARRELEEEVHLKAREIGYAGRNRFQFVDGFSLDVHVFLVPAFEGRATETDEALPLWTPVSAIPYAEMWEDDRIWLPKVLAGTGFSARYVFDGERMLDHAIELRRSGER